MIEKITLKFLAYVYMACVFLLAGCAIPQPAKLSIPNTVARNNQNGVTPVQILQQGKIYYPALATSEKIEGTLRVRLYIDEKGLPKVVQIVDRKLNKKFVADKDGKWQDVTTIFDQAAIDSFNKSVWKPSMKDGNPQAIWVEVPLNFTVSK